MKTTKRGLGILLALALALALFAPMAAAEGPGTPIIVSLTPDPTNTKFSLSTSGKMTLLVQAATPPEYSGTLEYQWYEGEIDRFGQMQNRRPVAGAIGTSLEVSCAAQDIDAIPFAANKGYYAVITNRCIIDGVETPVQTYTKTFYVRFYASFFDSFLCLWQMPTKDATYDAWPVGEKILAYLAVVALTPFVPVIYFAGLLGLSPF